MSAVRKYFYARLAAAFSCPVICHFHTGSFVNQYSSASPGVRLFVRRLIDLADWIICVSFQLQTQLIRLFEVSKISVIPNLVCIPNLEPKGRILKNAPINLTYIGTIKRAKGIFDLIPIFQKIVRNYPGIVLNIAGKGDTSYLASLIREFHLSESVRMLGWVNATERDNLLRNTHIFVMPSYAEGLPMSILEAMSYGIPIVASDVGGIPEVVSHERCGFLSRPGDSATLYQHLTILIEKEDVRNSLGNQARKDVAAKCSLFRVVSQMDIIYSSLFNRLRVT